MIEKDNPPYAPNLVEAMRSIGYSFETAIADIIDNSIAANANIIEVVSILQSKGSFISIKDDGIGMNSENLFNAMKYGSSNPNNQRSEKDMGRFGLGLKSASLSQCRKLTVISNNGEGLCAYIWDIDYIIKTGSWSLQELEQEEIIEILKRLELSLSSSGTIVIWEKFDKHENSSIDINEHIKELLVNSIDHLSLIYHRLLNKSLQILVNGNEIIAKDPFLENHKSTQLKREQKIIIDNKEIIIKPYILPHINKLSDKDIIKIGGKESLRSEQGFYIYRNKRLILWGTWFRLVHKNELSKLARVRVDIPNDMDYLWDIDIKKSKVSLPNKIKINLYNAVLESCDLSEKVHEYKGKKANNDLFIHTWNVIEKRRGEGIGIEINKKNPLIEKFIDSLQANQKKIFELLIQDIESSVPIDYIYSQVAKGNSTEIELDKNEKEEKLKEIEMLIDCYVKTGLEKNECIDILLRNERYANDIYLKKRLKEMRET